MKICLECADGGHLDEMLCIMEAFNGEEIFFITFNTETTKNLEEIADVFYVPNFKPPFNIEEAPHIFRNIIVIIYILNNSVRSYKIIRHCKPDLIISTGGPITIPLFVCAKLFKVKSIYIESFTRIEQLSGTGKILYYIADIFLVQWETLALKYKKAKYWGGII